MKHALGYQRQGVFITAQADASPFQIGRFFNASTIDYGITFVVAAVISAVGYVGVSLIGGFLLFMFFIAIAIGGAIGEVALRLTGKRRGRYSGYVAGAGAVAGVLILGLIMFGQLVFAPTLLIYAGIVAFTAYGRFRLRI